MRHEAASIHHRQPFVTPLKPPLEVAFLFLETPDEQAE